MPGIFVCYRHPLNIPFGFNKNIPVDITHWNPRS